MIKTKVPIVAILKNPPHLGAFVAVSGVFFAANYYALKNLPHSDGFMCVMGGNLTATNLIFGALISIAAGLLAAGFFEQFRQKQTKKAIRLGSASSAGVILGTLTSFCTICTLPIISLFGIGAFMNFVSEHQLVFKIISLGLMSLGIYLVNSQLRDQCKGLCILGRNAS